MSDSFEFVCGRHSTEVVARFRSAGADPAKPIFREVARLQLPEAEDLMRKLGKVLCQARDNANRFRREELEEKREHLKMLQADIERLEAELRGA